MSRFGIKSQRVLLESGLQPATIWIESGKISAVTEGTQTPQGEGCPIFDAGRDVVMPGLVDFHAHINEPGRTDWEGFETATRAAAAGGITTVIDMPLNSIPATTSVSALECKADAARGKCSIDYGFWGGVIPGNQSELLPLSRAGVFGFKAFMIDSGVAEFPASDVATLREALNLLRPTGLPLIVHAELESPVPSQVASVHYSDYLTSRPSVWETEAISLLIELARETRGRVHVVHLSSAEALPLIQKAKEDGLQMTVETCPHYLRFHSEMIPDGATEFKCAPPIRSAENRERLWEGLQAGVIDFIVSDHSPCQPTLKLRRDGVKGSGDFMAAWGGISGLQCSLSVVWTEMVARGFSLLDLNRLMARGPAEFLGLSSRKGRLRVGLDADLVVFDPEAEFTLQPSEIRHRHLLTPYSMLTLKGVVKKTMVRGEVVYQESPVSGHGVKLCPNSIK